MKPPFPSLTAEWHNAPYPAISPSHPQHSHATQTIVITGAGTGIGRGAAIAYAVARAARLVLIGRREEMLQETSELVKAANSACEVEVYSASVTAMVRMKEVAAAVKGWDVLVLSAGRAARPEMVEDADGDLWWDVFETNVRGFFTTINAFLPSRRPNARILGVSAGIVNLPATYPPCHGSSAYASSKLAQIRLLEHVAAECPDAFVVGVHPGVVATDLIRESQMDVNVESALFDDVQLPAQFFVWATSPEGAFLRGKWVWANWDVEQLKARAQEIQTTPILTANILGWPFEAKQST